MAMNKKAYIKPVIAISSMKSELPVCGNSGGNGTGDIEDLVKGRKGFDDEDDESEKASLW